MKCLSHLNSEAYGTESSLQLIGALVFSILFVGEGLQRSAETHFCRVPCSPLLQRSGEIWILWQRREKLFHMITMRRHTALIPAACYEKLVNNLLLSMDHGTCPMCS